VNRISAELEAEKPSYEVSIRERAVRRKGRADALEKSVDRRCGVKGDLAMSRDRSNTVTMNLPAALRPARLRAGLALAVIAAIAAFAVRVQAQPAATQATVSVSTPDLQLASGLTFGF
jgi:hypothetical protein